MVIVLGQNSFHPIRASPILDVVRLDKDELGAELLPDETRHATLDPEVSSHVISRLNHLLVTYSNRLIGQAWIILYLNCGEKHIHIDVDPSTGQDSLFSDTVDQTGNLARHPIPLLGDSFHAGNLGLVLADLVFALLRLFVFLPGVL